MIEVHRHGLNYSDILACPYCKCVVEYTRDEINTDGYVECPECHEHFKGRKYQMEMPKYTRNLEKEAEAIQKSLECIDFDELAKACSVLATYMPESFDYLEDVSADTLKKNAKDEISHCFECMEEYGYLVNYKGGGIAYSYTIEGVFTVNTYYNPEDCDLWCTCDYTIASGRVY